MALTECANGHLYDNTQYASCPYCTGNMNRVEFGNNVPPRPAAPQYGGVPQQPAYGGVPQQPSYGAPQQPSYGAPQSSMSSIGSTVAPSMYQAQVNGAANVGKTVAVMQKNMGIEPVAGWLVCIEGKEKGKDYRIAAKNNSIGRDEKSDICIKGDETISRENHARLAYDVKHNAFHIIPGDGANNVYIGENPVYVPTLLKERDVIEMGESKFVFIPFCGDLFTWQEDKKQEG